MAATAGAATTSTKNHDHTGEMIMVTTTTGEIEVAHADLHGIAEGETRGVITANSRVHKTFDF